MREKNQTVLVSGGWGYGNIGDDALLEATYRLLTKFMPNATVIWTSYDVGLTRASGVLPKTVQLLPSVHRVMAGRRAFWDISTIGKIPNVWWLPYYVRRVYERFIRPFLMWVSCPSKATYCMRLQKSAVKGAFRRADVFIMSGGGYFNSWETMFEARLEELRLAHAYGCKVVLLGQSIGPFTERQRIALSKEICESDVIIVRDEVSQQELLNLGITARCIPDLALSLEVVASSDNDAICVIPAELQTSQIKVLAQLLKDVVKREVVVTLTRHIYPDVVTAKRLVCELSRSAPNLRVRFVMPKNYSEMKKVICSSAWVLSRGMHGMILGWCAGKYVFALTSSRKVDGFLNAIGLSHFQCRERQYAIRCCGGGLNALMEERECADVRPRLKDEIENSVRLALSK